MVLNVYENSYIFFQAFRLVFVLKRWSFISIRQRQTDHKSRPGGLMFLLKKINGILSLYILALV